MPELPEVESVRRGMASRVVGRRIVRVEVGRERSVRRTSARAVIDGLTGTTMLSAGRRGKYLVCPLDSGDSVMIHLRMTGQLRWSEPGATRPPHTHVVLHLGADPRRRLEPAEVWFVDPRTFGEVVVFDPDHVDVELPELSRLGVDPIADRFDADTLRQLLHGRSTRLKSLLLDQHVVAGIGNIYSDEILHAARLHPDRPAGTLTRTDVRRLHAETLRVLNEAIGTGGSTLSDNSYVDITGTAGSYQERHRVYGRAGQRCPTCGRGVVRRGVLAGRSYYFCPVCQRRPRSVPVVPGSPTRPRPSR